jgi:hypothetical protein
MIHTSFTHHTTHSRCPQRFYYRYLHRHSKASVEEKILIQRLACLYGFRELLGHLTHEALAKVVRQIADEGFSIADADIQLAEMLGQYRKVVEASRRFKCRVPNTGQIVIAEMVNGVDIEAEIADGSILLTHYFEKAIEIIHLLGLQQGDEIEAENDQSMGTHQGRFHLKIDLLLHRCDQVWVIDWKTKSAITRQDRYQVQLYLEWARRTYQLPPSRLIGMIASLQTGELQKVLFDVFSPCALTSPPPIASAMNPIALAPCRSKEEADAPPGKSVYSANPSPHQCRACPFASVCASAEIDSMEVCKSHDELEAHS